MLLLFKYGRPYIRRLQENTRNNNMFFFKLMSNWYPCFQTTCNFISGSLFGHRFEQQQKQTDIFFLHFVGLSSTITLFSPLNHLWNVFLIYKKDEYRVKCKSTKCHKATNKQNTKIPWHSKTYVITNSWIIYTYSKLKNHQRKNATLAMSICCWLHKMY